MRFFALWMLLIMAAMLAMPDKVTAEPTTDAPVAASADGKVVAGLFRRLFDGGRCGPGGCPSPDVEPDVPDDPPPPPKEPKAEPVAPESGLPQPLLWAIGIAGGVVALLLIIKRERG